MARKRTAKKAARKAPKRPPVDRLEREIKQVETYEYLLVEYIKEISNELTYLVLIVCALFLFVLIDIIPTFIPTPSAETYNLIRLIFILLIVGGFALFGVANITKRKIEKKFELIFTRY